MEFERLVYGTFHVPRIVYDGGHVNADDEIRNEVVKLFEEMHLYYRRGYTPKVKISKKCNACSLKDICLPVLNKKKSVSGYIDKIISEEEKE